MDMPLDFYLRSQSQRINQRLENLITEQTVKYNSLYQAARYSLLGPGKRLRPILALATVEMLNGNTEAALTPVCALEMIHTYSLIHDDLPCMDNDDFRRGRPTLHKSFPENLALLAGDFLLTYAFETLSKEAHLTAEQRLQLIQILSERSGSTGMIGGQVMDLAAEGLNIPIDHLQDIHFHKTGALISASCEFGGVLAQATQEQIQLLREFGYRIGLAFQIVDDILDVTASEVKHGKKVASDVANQKSTYVTLLGLEQAQAMAQSYLRLALDTLKQFSGDTQRLAELACLIVERTS